MKVIVDGSGGSSRVVWPCRCRSVDIGAWQPNSYGHHRTTTPTHNLARKTGSVSTSQTNGRQRFLLGKMLRVRTKRMSIGPSPPSPHVPYQWSSDCVGASSPIMLILFVHIWDDFDKVPGGSGVSVKCSFFLSLPEHVKRCRGGQRNQEKSQYGERQDAKNTQNAHGSKPFSPAHLSVIKSYPKSRRSTPPHMSPIPQRNTRRESPDNFRGPRMYVTAMSDRALT